MTDRQATIGHQPTASTEEVHPFQTSRVLTMSAGHGVHDTYTAFLPSLLPLFIRTLSLSKTEAGLLSVFMQGPSLLQPAIGHLADRLDLRVLVILAPAVTAAVMSPLGLVPSYALIALCLAVVGLSSASMHAVGPVITGHLSGQNLGRGMGLWMVGGELGRTLGPIVIVSAIQLLTLRGTPWLMAGGLLASLLLLILLRDGSGPSPEADRGLPWGRALRAMGPLLIPLTGIIVARAFMISALTTYLPTYLSEEGASLWLAGASLSILEAAGVVGALTGGALSDQLGRRTVMLISLVATPLLMFAFLALSGWTRLPLLLMLGFSGLSVTPVMMALVQESFPDNRALANGTYMALNFVLRSGVIVVLGRIGDLLGLRLAFTVSAVIPLVSLPLLLFVPKARPTR
jgi:FSR family fosmidomycin resistance protein-like MFS transporter